MDKKKKTLFKLVIAAVGMFAFGFALVPLYDVLCDITGLNGKTRVVENISAEQLIVHADRKINVQFITTRNQSLPIEFYPMQKTLTVSPGAITSIEYHVKNLTDRPIITQAIPSLTPPVAASYFKKIECFCFDNQVLEAQEEKTFTMRFVVDSKIPKHFQTITLAYTLFDVSGKAS